MGGGSAGGYYGNGMGASTGMMNSNYSSFWRNSVTIT
jgi:hypothetical protein